MPEFTSRWLEPANTTKSNTDTTDKNVSVSCVSAPSAHKSCGNAEPVITDEEATVRGWWTLGEMTRYLSRLSDADLADYRRALAFDAEALRRLDARSAQGATTDAA